MQAMFARSTRLQQVSSPQAPAHSSALRSRSVVSGGVIRQMPNTMLKIQSSETPTTHDAIVTIVSSSERLAIANRSFFSFRFAFWVCVLNFCRVDYIERGSWVAFYQSRLPQNFPSLISHPAFDLKGLTFASLPGSRLRFRAATSSITRTPMVELDFESDQLLKPVFLD